MCRRPCRPRARTRSSPAGCGRTRASTTPADSRCSSATTTCARARPSTRFRSRSCCSPDRRQPLLDTGRASGSDGVPSVPIAGEPGGTSMRSRLLSAVVGMITIAVFVVPVGLSSQAGAAPPASAPGEAPGAPGALSHFDLARKDCVGTARNTTSKIWYPVADGVLSDVYAPTIDTTNVETMQYIVTDDSTFTDLQSRDTTYTVSTDASGMMCTVTSTAKSGKYQLTSTYLTDVARDTVVVRTAYTALVPAAAKYHLYVRLDATVAGNGGGGGGTKENGGADSAVVDQSTGSPVPVAFDTVTT